MNANTIRQEEVRSDLSSEIGSYFFLKLKHLLICIIFLRIIFTGYCDFENLIQFDRNLVNTFDFVFCETIKYSLLRV